MKSLFISGFMMMNLVGFILSTLMYVRDGLTVGIGLTMLASLGVLLYFLSLYIMFIPPRSNHPGLPILTSIFLTLAGFASGFNAVEGYWILFPLSMISGLGWIVFVFWYSKLDRAKSNLLAQGKPLPEMEFLNVDQSRWTTKALKGKRALIVFYRGSWCPLCMAQVRELANKYQSFRDMDVEVIFVSPQPISYNQSLATRWDIPITFLQDPHLKESKRLGIFHRAGTPAGMQVFGFETDTVYPTVLGVDEMGIIQISDQTDNYRIRVSPDILIEQFRHLGSHALSI